MLVPVSGHLPVKPMSGVEIAQSQAPVQPAGDGGHGRHARSPSRTSTPSATTSIRSRRSRASSSSSTPACRRRRSCSTSPASPCSAATSTTPWSPGSWSSTRRWYARSAAGGKARIDAVPRRRLRAARLAFAAGRAERRRWRRRWRSASADVETRGSLATARVAQDERARARWWQRSIGGRIVVLFLGLLLTVQVASFVALRDQPRRACAPGRCRIS